MLHTLWILICYQPLYNALLFCISLVPGGDVGLAVILLTIIVKLILFPLTQKSIDAQIKMKAIEGKVNEIKEKFTDKAEQSKKTFALYKENKVNPFSSCLLILIQMPIIIALYMVFIHGFDSVPVDPYSFIHVPATFNLNFFGIMNLAEKSMYLAILAGVTQFIQGYLAQGRQTKPTGDDMKAEFAKSMQTQMVYVLPLMIIFISYKVSAAVALYWITSNIFTIGQELYTRRKAAKNSSDPIKVIAEIKA
jgi:YidC/Oxa1 family membrane protein insertase